MSYSEISKNDGSDAWQKVSDELRLAALLLQQGKTSQAAKILSGKPAGKTPTTRSSRAQPSGESSERGTAATDISITGSEPTRRRPKRK